MSDPSKNGHEITSVDELAMEYGVATPDDDDLAEEESARGIDASDSDTPVSKSAPGDEESASAAKESEVTNEAKDSSTKKKPRFGLIAKFGAVVLFGLFLFNVGQSLLSDAPNPAEAVIARVEAERGAEAEPEEPARPDEPEPVTEEKSDDAAAATEESPAPEPEISEEEAAARIFAEEEGEAEFVDARGNELLVGGSLSAQTRTRTPQRSNVDALFANEQSEPTGSNIPPTEILEMSGDLEQALSQIESLKRQVRSLEGELSLMLTRNDLISLERNIASLQSEVQEKQYDLGYERDRPNLTRVVVSHPSSNCDQCVSNAGFEYQDTFIQKANGDTWNGFTVRVIGNRLRLQRGEHIYDYWSRS